MGVPSRLVDVSDMKPGLGAVFVSCHLDTGSNNPDYCADAEIFDVDYLAGAEGERQHVDYDMNATSLFLLGCVPKVLVLWRIVEADRVARFESGRHGWRGRCCQRP